MVLSKIMTNDKRSIIYQIQTIIYTFAYAFQKASLTLLFVCLVLFWYPAVTQAPFVKGEIRISRADFAADHY